MSDKGTKPNFSSIELVSNSGKKVTLQFNPAATKDQTLTLPNLNLASQFFSVYRSSLSSYTVTSQDNTAVIIMTGGSTRTVILDSTPIAGQRRIIVDGALIATQSPITISAEPNRFANGATTMQLQLSMSAVVLVWDGAYWWPIESYGSFPASVDAPNIIQPLNGATEVQLPVTIKTTAFSTTGGIQDRHLSTRWQVSSDDQFASTVYDQTTPPSIQQTIPAGLLVTNTLYYCKVTYTGQSGSASVTTSFRTTATPAPEISSPIEGQSTVLPTLTVTTAPFAGSGTHQQSTWQFSVVQTFTSVQHTSGDDSVNLTSYTVPTGKLAPGYQYFVRVRFKSSTTGWSAWSQPVSFTPSAVNTPVLTAPTPFYNLLSINNFSCAGYQDSHEQTQWQVSSDSSFATSLEDSTVGLTTHRLSPQLLLNNSQYYARVRVKGSVLGWSPWCQPVSFTTARRYGWSVSIDSYQQYHVTQKNGDAYIAYGKRLSKMSATGILLWTREYDLITDIVMIGVSSQQIYIASSETLVALDNNGLVQQAYTCVASNLQDIIAVNGHHTNDLITGIAVTCPPLQPGEFESAPQTLTRAAWRESARWEVVGSDTVLRFRQDVVIGSVLYTFDFSDYRMKPTDVLPGIILAEESCCRPGVWHVDVGGSRMEVDYDGNILVQGVGSITKLKWNDGSVMWSRQFSVDVEGISSGDESVGGRYAHLIAREWLQPSSLWTTVALVANPKQAGALTVGTATLGGVALNLSQATVTSMPITSSVVSYVY